MFRTRVLMTLSFFVALVFDMQRVDQPRRSHGLPEVIQLEKADEGNQLSDQVISIFHFPEERMVVVKLRGKRCPDPLTAR